MRALVTGANGFLGSYLLRYLLQQGCDATILLRPSSNTWRIGDLLERVQIIRTDTAGVKTVAEDIRASKPDVVYHLAWTGGNSYQYLNDPAQVYANIYGGMDLLQIAAESGARRWIGFGSVIEYGPYEGVIKEDFIPRPDTLYGISKYALCMMSEKMCELIGLDFAWIRPFWAYGPQDDPLRMITMVIETFLKKDKPALTPGEQLWDYLYVEDAVQALYQLAIVPKTSGVFNLGSGTTIKIRDVVETIRDLIDPSLPTGLGEIPYRPNQIMHLEADITRLKEVAHWQPMTDIHTGLRKTVEWYSERAASKDAI